MAVAARNINAASMEESAHERTICYWLSKVFSGGANLKSKDLDRITKTIK